MYFQQILLLTTGLWILGLVSLIDAVHIDESCSVYSSWLNQDLINRVFAAAAQAADALGDPMNDPDAIEQDIFDLADLLFGDRMENWVEAQRRLRLVSQLPRNPSPNDQNEVEIYCGDAYIQPLNPPRQGWFWDRIERMYVNITSAGFRDCYGDTYRTAAYTINPIDDARHTVIKLCPWYTEIMNDFVFNTAVRSHDEVVTVPIGEIAPPTEFEPVQLETQGGRLMCQLWRHGERISQPIYNGKTDMDLAALFEHTLLHEFTHHKSIQPIESNESYGWIRCWRRQWPANADSLAYFALGVDLHMSCNVAFNDDGDILVDPIYVKHRRHLAVRQIMGGSLLRLGASAQ